MYYGLVKFVHQMNGHVFKQAHALTAIEERIICQEIALHKSYAPILMSYQIRDDFRNCFIDLMLVAIGNILIGLYVSCYEPFGYLRIFGCLSCVFGSCMLVKILQHQPYRLPVEIRTQTNLVEEAHLSNS